MKYYAVLRYADGSVVFKGPQTRWGASWDAAHAQEYWNRSGTLIKAAVVKLIKAVEFL